MSPVRRESSAIMIGRRERVVVEPRAPQTPYLVSSSRASTPSRIFRSVDGDQGGVFVWSSASACTLQHRWKVVGR